MNDKYQCAMCTYEAEDKELFQHFCQFHREEFEKRCRRPEGTKVQEIAVQRGDGKQQEARVVSTWGASEALTVLPKRCPTCNSDSPSYSVISNPSGRFQCKDEWHNAARQASQPSQVSGEHEGVTLTDEMEAIADSILLDLGWKPQGEGRPLVMKALKNIAGLAARAMAEKAAQRAERNQGTSDITKAHAREIAKQIRALARPEGCICSEAYGVGPEKCGKHADE